MALTRLGDLAAARRAPADPRAIDVAESDATLAEIIARQVPLVADLRPDRVEVYLGGRDLLDGHDESYVHARLVELCDRLSSAAPSDEIELVAIPPLGHPAASAPLAELRRQCNAAGQVTASMRGFTWRHGQ